jgi:hypothetical protein
MPIPPNTELRAAGTPHAMFMTLCMLAGPIVFLTILVVAYSWASGYCQHFSVAGLLAVALVPTSLTGAAAYACRRELLRVRPLNREDAAHARAHFVAAVGLLLNAFSTVLLIGLTLPILLLRPCD